MNLLNVMALTAVAAVAACGAPADRSVSAPGSQAPASAAADPGSVAGICAAGATECNDTPDMGSGEPVAVDETGLRQFRRDAKFYLGKREDQLNELIRIGRIGNDQRALTEDYQIGRITVELDEVDGTFVVTKSTVEMPDGPETFELEQ